MNDNSRKILKAMMELDPDEPTIESLYPDVNLIIEEYQFIGGLEYSNYIVDIVISSLNKTNKDKYRLLQLMKRQLASVENKNKVLNQKQKNSLFELFEKNIKYSTYGDKVNSILIGIELSESQIKWLIDNIEVSPHILNRLLRYPKENDLVTGWAIEEYANGTYSERNSELLSKFISLENCAKYPRDEAIWAVYYSYLENGTKENILNNIFDQDEIDNWLEVVKRLEFISLLKSRLSQ